MSRRRVRNVLLDLAAPVALSVLCGVGFAAVYLLTVRTTPGRVFGDASLRGALLAHSRVADAVDGTLRVVSSATLLAAMAAIVLIALVRLRRIPGLAAVGLLVAANLSTRLLKSHLLSRPDLGLSEVTPTTHNSLPSGHTTAVFSAVVALMVVVPRSWRRTVAGVGGAGVVAVALATMSAGWHRAGDSIAAVLLVGVWAGVAGIVVVLADPTASARSASPHGDERSPRWLIAGTVGASAAGLCLAFGLAVIGPLQTGAVGAVAAFVAGGMFISAAVSAVLLTELHVLVRTDP